MMNNYEFVNYKNNGISIDVRYDEENKTFWLIQSEIAQAFKITKDNVKQIIKRVHESTKNSPVGDNLSPTEIQIDVVGADAKTYKTKAYNLDMIEAISQRSKSTNGYDFVKWAKEYINNNSRYSNSEMSPYEADNYDIATFEDGDFKLNITVSPLEETVWLTQDDIAKLFETTKQNISAHIINILNENELEKNSVVKNLLTAGLDGKKYYIKHYNFDMVLSIGYRVNGKRGIEFRKWATKILKKYSFNGYVINEKKINEIDEKYNVLAISHLKSLNEQNEMKTEMKEMRDDIINLKGEKEVFKGMILFEGDFYTGYSFTKRLMLSAKEKIILVDGYMDLSVLDMLNEVDSNLPITIYTYPSARLTNKEIAKFSETHNLTYIRRTILHGRFLAIDDDLYLFDGSIKDIGKNRTVVVKIDFTTIDKIIEEKE